MHHGTCVTHRPWSMSGSLTRVGGENVPGIPRACAPRNFTYLVRSPWNLVRVLHNYLRHPHNTKGQLWKCVYLSCVNSNVKSSKINHTTKICQISSDRMFVSGQTSIAITWLPHTAGVSCDLWSFFWQTTTYQCHNVKINCLIKPTPQRHGFKTPTRIETYH